MPLAHDEDVGGALGDVPVEQRLARDVQDAGPLAGRRCGPRTNRPPRSAPSRVRHLGDRPSPNGWPGSTDGLMNITVAGERAPGHRVGRELEPLPDARASAAGSTGTVTVRSSSRLSTMRNIGLLPPMFSTRSPTFTLRSATTPSIGAWMDDFASRASPVRTCARAARVAASAASSADVASSSACCVMRPYSFSCTRAIVLAPRARLRHPGLRLDRLQRLDARPRSPIVSSRASRAPLRTGTHSVTYTAVTVPDTSDFTSATNFGASDPTTSTVSTISDAQAASRLTATGGPPAVRCGLRGSLPRSSSRHRLPPRRRWPRRARRPS